MTGARTPDWWRSAVFYQVYPRSFQDSDGDGIGDLQGIIDRLDYLNDGTERSLGVDAIWLSPTYPSPMKDFGYDVADYTAVHPDFGDLETLDRLIEECHRRDIHLLLDFVPNHTSNEHPWFVESRSSRESDCRDWYYWRDAQPDGSPPNNWLSVFGGPAWEWDSATGQYYLHSFLVEQPDLNWRNPDVVEAMHNVLRFWLKRGVDGFRIDVMHMLLKHPDLANNPMNPDWMPGMPERRSQLWVNNQNYPDVYGAVRGIRRVIEEFPGSVTVGEVAGTPQQIAGYYGDDLHGLHMAFNFQLIQEPGSLAYTTWDAETIRRIVTAAERALPQGGQACFAFSNHDQPRFRSRHDADGRGNDRARAAILFLLGLQATPFLYYGEEIGMVDVAIPDDQLVDPARFRYRNRDPARTPMQWDGSASRGFTTGQPWLPFGPSDISVAAQARDPTSILTLYRRAIWTRKADPALSYGVQGTQIADDHVVMFVRRTDGSAPPVLVAVNTSDHVRSVPLPWREGRIIVASAPEIDGQRIRGSLTLPPLAAAWVRLG